MYLAMKASTMSDMPDQIMISVKSASSGLTSGLLHSRLAHCDASAFETHVTGAPDAPHHWRERPKPEADRTPMVGEKNERVPVPTSVMFIRVTTL